MVVNTLRYCVGLTVALAALAGLAALTFTMMQGGTLALDHATLAGFAALRTAGADAFFQAVTWLGSGWFLAPAALLIALTMAWRGRWAPAGLLGLTYFGASLTTWLLKMGLGRERPTLHPTLEAFVRTDGSFPSGHATHAAAFALGLWLLAAHFRLRWRTAAGLVLAVVVLSVMASRLYLQAHWPSDVAAGLLVAAIWAGLALAVARHPRING